MKDNRIVVIHQENSGVTKARERGVLEVTDCEFITFVDADDVLVIDALETLLFYMQPNINIVLGEIVRFRGDVHINETKHNYRRSHQKLYVKSHRGS
jgi:glycosyltransferase involved in cell wall biosynthesis